MTDAQARVDRMRRTLERSREATEARERREWLAAMTPEHRARHEKPNPFAMMCGLCIQEQGRLTAENVQRIMGGGFTVEGVGRALRGGR